MADAEADEPPRPTVGPSWRDVVAWRAASVDRRAVAAVAGVLLAVGVLVAAWALLRTPQPPPTELLLPYAPGAGGAPPATTVATPATAPFLVVHAAGAVAAPGVHQVPAGSRVEDVLVAAGGPTPDADLDRVNLAAPVADGERVWIPRIGEEPPTPVAGAVGGGGGGATGQGPPGPVDLNTASAEELDTLPGVGPATAAAIIEHRERAGPFGSVDELLEVPGIGDAKLAQLRDLVSV